MTDPAAEHHPFDPTEPHGVLAEEVRYAVTSAIAEWVSESANYQTMDPVVANNALINGVMVGALVVAQTRGAPKDHRVLRELLRENLDVLFDIARAVHELAPLGDQQ